MAFFSTQKQTSFRQLVDSTYNTTFPGKYNSSNTYTTLSLKFFHIY